MKNDFIKKSEILYQPSLRALLRVHWVCISLFSEANGITLVIILEAKTQTSDLCCSEREGKRTLYGTKGSFWSLKAGFTSPNLKCLRVRFLVTGGHLIQIYHHWRRMDYFRGSFFPFVLDIKPRLTESSFAGSCLSFHWLKAV